MNYKGFELSTKDNTLVVENIIDFDTVNIFECGQCFRWVRQEDGSYRGIVRDKLVNVSYQDGTLYITNSDEQDFIDIWYDYFDLGTDYSAIKALLCKDDIMRAAIETGRGIRLLRQDFWEVLISFIISANNRIPRIMKTVDMLSQLMGKCITDHENAYMFPTVEALAARELEEINMCRAGFRCKYIYESAKMINDFLVKREDLLMMNTDAARNELMKLPGVGPKVADCILLFSGTKFDVFPTDVWVKRVMEELYFKREASLKEIQLFAKQYFGDLTGYAQQYLFYYARLNRIGMR
jgi:N-glycosylase/DNA lyase